MAAVSSRKELARQKKEEARRRKEEAKRLKREKRLAKKAGREEAALPEEAEVSLPEPVPFFESPKEALEEPVRATMEKVTEPPFDLPLEAEKEGIKLPRLEDRLEFLPPLEEEEGPPPGKEPPEGFFD